MARRIRRKHLWICLSLPLSLAGYAAFEYWRLPQVDALRSVNPKTTAWMEMRAAQAAEAGRKIGRRQIWRPYKSFSPSLVSAVLAAEDASFFGHHGFDYREIQESLKKNWEEKEFARGASTITQQLAKNLYLSPSKNPLRKLKEAVLTYRLEKSLSKARILELYLNVIEWGDGIYGAEAAAEAYFGKTASGLNVNESALLSAMIVNPIRYAPARKSRTLVFRYHWILEVLHESGKLDDGAFAAAMEARVALRDGGSFP